MYISLKTGGMSAHVIDGIYHTGEGDIVTRNAADFATALALSTHIGDSGVGVHAAGAAGAALYQAPTNGAIRNLIKAALIYKTASDPNANNDGVDTAGIGQEFTVGDVWMNTSVTPRSWFRCDRNNTGAAVWTQFNPAALSALYATLVHVATNDVIMPGPGTYDANSGDRIWCTGAAVVNLPAAPNNGDTIMISNRDGSNVTINGNGQNINGAASYLSAILYESLILYYTAGPISEWGIF